VSSATVPAVALNNVCQLQVDAVAAMTSAVDLIMSRDPPTRLDAFGALLSNPAADSAPATPSAAAAEVDPFAESALIEPPSPDAPAAPPAPATALHPPVSDGWIVHALGTFCLTLVDAPDAAAATEAARSLLHLTWLHATLHFPRLQVATVPEQWARTAISALFRIGDPADAVAAREAVTQIVSRYLCVLAPDDVPAVARRALRWVVQRSSASARVSCLQLIWRAAVDCDLSLWRRSQAEALAPEALAAPPRAPRPHGNTLIELLEDPLVKSFRAGDAAVRLCRTSGPLIACLPLGTTLRIAMDLVRPVAPVDIAAKYMCFISTAARSVSRLTSADTYAFRTRPRRGRARLSTRRSSRRCSRCC
jgi:hypothetical protein